MALTAFWLLSKARKEIKRSRDEVLPARSFLIGSSLRHALLYGMAGSTNVGDIANSLSQSWPSVQQAVKAWAMVLPALTERSQGLRPLLLLGMIALAAGCSSKSLLCHFTCGRLTFTKARRRPSQHFFHRFESRSFALYLRIFNDALEPMRTDWAPLLGLSGRHHDHGGQLGRRHRENSNACSLTLQFQRAGYLLLGLIAANLCSYSDSSSISSSTR